MAERAYLNPTMLTQSIRAALDKHPMPPIPVEIVRTGRGMYIEKVCGFPGARHG